MKITPEQRSKKLIVVGDRVLIRPTKTIGENISRVCNLPPGVQEKGKIQSGYVIKVGRGYPRPLPIDEDDDWKGNR